MSYLLHSKLTVIATCLALTACAHQTTSVPCPPPPGTQCSQGYIALYFEPETETFARPFTAGFGWLTEVADRCDLTFVAITGLPDPARPDGAPPLALKRAERVRDFLNAFGIPVTEFEYGNAEQQAKPGISFNATPAPGR